MSDVTVGTWSRWGTIAVSLAMVLVVAACTAGKTGATSASTTPIPSAPASEALETLYISPGGFSQDSDASAQTGPLDISRAAQEESTHESIATLTRDGFVAGYQRIWHSPSGGRLLIYLYQFRDSTGALDYLNRQIRSDLTVAGAQTFPVTAVPGATGLKGGSTSRPAVIVWITRGAYVALVGYDATTTTQDCEDTAVRLARSQYTRL